MRALLQRVSHAAVEVEGSCISEIDTGLLIFLGIAQGDTEANADIMVKKIIHLRVFPHEKKNFEKDLIAMKGAILLVSQFTLLADTRKGRKPDFHNAAPPETARFLYDYIATQLKQYCPLAQGIFAAKMRVTLVNEGPASIILET